MPLENSTIQFEKRPAPPPELLAPYAVFLRDCLELELAIIDSVDELMKSFESAGLSESFEYGMLKAVKNATELIKFQIKYPY